MKILVLCGSPHTNGTTAYLADEFCAGAKEAGHDTVRVETAHLKIYPCLGCEHCIQHDEKCVYEDDIAKVFQDLLAADAVVLVTPLYYFGMTAQLKSLVDRFFSVNTRLRQRPKKLLLIAAGSDNTDWAMEALRLHVQTICRYLNWQEGGMVLATGAGVKGDVINSEFSLAARALGREL
jgi:multimeric flavodoxin WrbA